ncbi:DUF6058 family natural product biosynthesis protein [Undibacterium cyanobacteriorum]|uniref:DUF6058 family natural product biosynthesis protein n=1 Tax=Undibacterium cyanobacteriorum TaxID=3073561 RepID=A0ABY9RKF6_9BURK|nr:DUF6058 family natural product biosynthesis protein [Undibacterium sp. 20NA77.5]WMW80755.1 DUF6058 family natural product biosynthesis protein [Undibacterium sp. 20NA77.5]
MSPQTQHYLDQFYISDLDLMQAWSVAREEFDHLLSEGVLASPSYWIHAGRLHSVVFGDLEASDLADQQFFHRDLREDMQARFVYWREHGVAATLAHFEQRFKQHCLAALLNWQQQRWPLQDCTNDDGERCESALQERANKYWDYLQQGIFGLCVQQAGSVSHIVEKELLQERLSLLYQSQTELAESTSASSEEPSFAQTKSCSSASTIAELQTNYARACMPFSPVEYPRSSRYRLLELLQSESV